MGALAVLLFYLFSYTNQASANYSASANECVIELCGDPNDSDFNQLYQQYLSSKNNYSIPEEAENLISESSDLIEQIFDIAYETSPEIIKYYQSMKDSGNLDNIKTQAFYDQIYKHIFTSHPNFDIRHDSQRSIGDRFYIDIHNLASTELDEKINDFFEKKIFSVNELYKSLIFKNNDVVFGLRSSSGPLYGIPHLRSTSSPETDPNVLEMNRYLLSCDQDCKILIDQIITHEELDQFMEQLRNNDLNKVRTTNNHVERIKKSISTIYSFSNFITENYNLDENIRDITADVKARFSNKMIKLLGDSPASKHILAEFLQHHFPWISPSKDMKHWRIETRIISSDIFYIKLQSEYRTKLDLDVGIRHLFNSYISERLNLKTYVLEPWELTLTRRASSIFNSPERELIEVMLASGNNSYNFRTNGIYLSLKNLLFPDLGRQTLAHELGHAFSAFMNGKLSKSNEFEELITYEAEDEVYNKYIEIRQCSDELYKMPENITIDESMLPHFSPLSHEGDTIKSEEDMADLIENLLFEDEPTLENCPFVYSDNYLLRYETIDTNNTTVHSSPLLRLIVEALYKGYEMPTSCKDVMAEYDDQINFNLCF